MLSELLILLFLVIAVEAITEIIVSSTIFQPLRNTILKCANEFRICNFLGKLIQCGYCTSVWISLMVAWIVPFNLINHYVDFIIFTFVLHRLSNFWHEFLSRWFSRHPIILSISLFKSGDVNESESESESESKS